MSRPYICDACDARLGELQPFILEVTNIATLVMHNQHINVHFCSYNCLVEWAETMREEYETNR